MGPWVLYLLFLGSGISGLIYQVAWVRQFGHAFGNTIHSTSLIVAIFMLGLGVGGYAAGIWADRRYQASATLIRAYACAEGLLAILALALTLGLPLLGSLVATFSSYTTSAEGWHVLTVGSYAARAVVALALLTPVTLIMGATLTLLIRSLVRTDVWTGGWKIALLYAANTGGAAVGALLTDMALVPLLGLRGTQLVAVAMNLLIGGVAWLLMVRHGEAVAPVVREQPHRPPPGQSPALARPEAGGRAVFRAVGMALALSGFAVMGMEILWLRHAVLLLGGFRAVFSILMTVLLLGLGTGALFGGWVHRRSGRPGEALVLTQALFVVLALLGLGSADIATVQAHGDALTATLSGLGPWRGRWPSCGTRHVRCSWRWAFRHSSPVVPSLWPTPSCNACRRPSAVARAGCILPMPPARWPDPLPRDTCSCLASACRERPSCWLAWPAPPSCRCSACLRCRGRRRRLFWWL